MIELTRYTQGARHDNTHGVFGQLVLKSKTQSLTLVTQEKPVVITNTFPKGAPFDSCLQAGKYLIVEEQFKIYPRKMFCLFGALNGTYLHADSRVNPRRHVRSSIYMGIANKMCRANH